MSGSKGSVWAFLSGLFVGAGIAVLLTPKSGKETRENLKKVAGNVEGFIKEKGEHIKNVAEEKLGTVKEGIKTVVEDGKRIFEEEKAKLKEKFSQKEGQEA